MPNVPDPAALPLPDPAPPPPAPDVDIRVAASKAGEHVLLLVLEALLPSLPKALEAVELVDAHLRFKVAAPGGAKAVVLLAASITDNG